MNENKEIVAAILAAAAVHGSGASPKTYVDAYEAMLAELEKREEDHARQEQERSMVILEALGKR